MKHLAAIALAVFAAVPIAAQELTSDYTKVDQQNDCHVIARAADGEGDWADLVCPGYGHYPYVLSYGDGHEQVFFLDPDGYVLELFEHTGEDQSDASARAPVA